MCLPVGLWHRFADGRAGNLFNDCIDVNSITEILTKMHESNSQGGCVRSRRNTRNGLAAGMNYPRRAGAASGWPSAAWSLGTVLLALQSAPKVHLETQLRFFPTGRIASEPNSLCFALSCHEAARLPDFL